MPCAECGNPLIISHEHNDLRCAYCLNLDVADPGIVQQKIDRDRDRLRDENLVKLVENYSKDHLLLYLIERLNITAHDFYDTRRLDHSQFSYLNNLIQIILSVDSDRFGDEYLERDTESLDSVIQDLIGSRSEVVNALNHIEENFRLCLEYPVPPINERFVFGEYDLKDTEFRQCFFRNLRSLMGGKEEYVDYFDEASTELRNFDWPGFPEDQSLRDFAETSFEFIIALMFTASADEMVGDVYTTFPPDNISVFDLSELFDRLDNRFASNGENPVLQSPNLAMTGVEELDEIGQQVFPDNWIDVRETIVFSKENMDAHPFLFELEVEEKIKEVPGRPPLTRQVTRIIYPRWYDQILRFQIFPMLQNGDDPSGHEILNEVVTDRGLAFEENVYGYMQSQGLESFYSAEIPGVDSSEIDVLSVDHDSEQIWFVECKYLLPALKMNAREGILELNGKFDHKVFNVEAAGYEGSPTGQPFPKKVDEWLDLEPGHEFRWNRPSEEGTMEERIQSKWFEYQPRMMVVSNLCPSYPEKWGVEFLTDMELVMEMHDTRDHAMPIHDMV